MEAPPEVSDAVRPGVVSRLYAWGHTREETRLTVARAHAGASLNDLTDDQVTDTLCGTAGFSGIGVEVTPP